MTGAEKGIIDTTEVAAVKPTYLIWIQSARVTMQDMNRYWFYYVERWV